MKQSTIGSPLELFQKLKINSHIADNRDLTLETNLKDLNSALRVSNRIKIPKPLKKKKSVKICIDPLEPQ